MLAVTPRGVLVCFSEFPEPRTPLVRDLLVRVSTTPTLPPNHPSFESEVPELWGHSVHSVGMCPCSLQYSLSTKRSSPDDGNDVSPYSLSPVSNKR